jgi:hypothetical protein
VVMQRKVSGVASAMGPPESGKRLYHRRSAGPQL